ncbi:MAG: serine hydrolase [Gemmatimonadota bacterium]
MLYYRPLASGARLDHFLDAELYGPLGLEDTGFRPRSEALATPQAGIVATSHGNPFERRMVHDPDFGYTIDLDPERWSDWRGYTLVGEVNDGNAWHAFEGVAGHAGLFASAPDLGVLLRLLLARGSIDEHRMISAETVDHFLSPQLEGQALGWQLPDYAPEGSFGHTGFTGTFVLGVPSRGLGLVLLTNRQNGGVDAETQYPDVGPLQRAIVSALMDER